MDDDGAAAGIGIGLVEAIETQRAAMLAVIFLGREIGALRTRRGAGHIGEGIEEAIMILVGAPAVRGPVSGDEAGIEIDNEEPFLGGMKAVIDHDQLARMGEIGMPAHRLDGLAQ